MKNRGALRGVLRRFKNALMVLYGGIVRIILNLNLDVNYIYLNEKNEREELI